MKRKTKAITPAPALFQNEQAALLSVLSGGKLDRQRSAQLLRLLNGKNLKRLIVGGIGLSVAAQAMINVSREQSLRHAISKELKKQLSPLEVQLRELENQVNSLNKEVQALRKELKH